LDAGSTPAASTTYSLRLHCFYYLFTIIDSGGLE